MLYVGYTEDHMVVLTWGSKRQLADAKLYKTRCVLWLWEPEPHLSGQCGKTSILVWGGVFKILYYRGRQGMSGNILEWYRCLKMS